MSMWLKQYAIGPGYTLQRECSNELVAELLANRSFTIGAFSKTPFHGIRFYDDAEHEHKVRHDVARLVVSMTDEQKAEFVTFVQSIPSKED